MKTLHDIAADLLLYYKSRRYRSQTIRTLHDCLKLFLEWLTKHQAVATSLQLTPPLIQQYQQTLANKVNTKGLPLSPKYLNTQAWALRTFLKYLYKNNYLTQDLSKQIISVKERKPLPQVLTHHDITKLITAIPQDTNEGQRDRTILELLYSSGIRNGELTGLTLDNIDLKTRELKVTGKGGKERIVPIGKTAAKSLETYIKAIRPFYTNPGQSKALFLNSRGNPLATYSIQRIVKKHAAEHVPDEHVTPHTFRRTCTTELIRANANLYHVKELLGHESLDTLKPYTRLTIEDLKKTHARCHPRG